jgi:sulfane dehydrogenase subunit SoxC
MALGARSVSGQGHDHGSGDVKIFESFGANHPIHYGKRSRFAEISRIPMNMGVDHLDDDANGLSAFSPLSQLRGSITPSGLHYISSHGSPPPDIDPREHRLMIYGMVDRPLVYTVDELKRLPFVSNIHYIECVENGVAPYPRGKTVDQMHGMASCSEWTGVPLSLLLKEAGVRDGAHWILCEGAEVGKLSNSMPLAKGLLDTFVAYAQNGEPLQPHQGYPLRLVVPGFQGKFHIKWLKGLKVVDRPYMTRWEWFHFEKTSPRPRPTDFNSHTGAPGGEFLLEQGPKSVITFPSGEQQLPGHGFYMITGVAYSGSGAIKRVEVSTDGGRTWSDAQIDGPARRIAFTTFSFPWTWKGGTAMLQSRCTDDKNQVQPMWSELTKFWANSGAPHNNAIQVWEVRNDGTVRNANAL